MFGPERPRPASMPRPKHRSVRPVLVAAAAVCALGLGALAVLPDPAVPVDSQLGRPADPGSTEPEGGQLTAVGGRAADSGGDAVGSAASEVSRSALRADVEEGVEASATLTGRLARLRVITVDEGAPVGGVELGRLWDGEERLTSGAELSSGEAGLWELRWRGGETVDAEIEAAGFERVTVVDIEHNPVEVVEVRMRRGATLTLASEGFEEGAEGLIVLYRSPKADGRAILRQAWQLDEELRLDVRPGPLSAVLIAPGQPPTTQLGFDVASGEALRMVFQADRGELLRGRVVEKTTRRPLAGVEVQARPKISGLGGEVARLAYGPVVSGDDGRFEIDGLPLGPLDLSLAPAFGPPVIRQVHVAEGEAARTRDLAVGGPASVSGRVRLGEGLDPKGLAVLIIAPGELSRLHPDPAAGGGGLLGRKSMKRGAVAEVSADGSFRCDSAPAGRPIGVLAQTGSAMAYLKLSAPLAPGEERKGVELSLERPDPALLRVVNDLDEPVPGVEASVRFLVSTAAAGGSGAMWSRDQLLLDPGGRFELPIPANAVRRVRLNAEGHLPLDTSWPLIGGEPAAEPTFQMIACSPVEILVQNESGFAVPGARVEAWPRGQTSGDAGAARMLRAARCNGRGRTKLELDRGVADWVVRARAGGHRLGDEVTVSKGSGAELRLVLEREEVPSPGTISGRLTRRGDGGEVPGLAFGGLRGGVAVLDGADFELRGIRPGRVQIVASAPGFESVSIPVDQLEPGQSVQVPELSTQRTLSAEVAVTDAAGNRIRKAKVRLVRLGEDRGGRSDVPKKLSFPAVGDLEGRFRRGGIPRGKWILAVDHPTYARFRETVTIMRPEWAFEVTLERKKGR